MEVIPYTLAENAALNPIEVVTELRKRHNAGEKNAGINVRKVNDHVIISTVTDQLYLGWRVRYGYRRSVSTTFSLIIYDDTFN